MLTGKKTDAAKDDKGRPAPAQPDKRAAEKEPETTDLAGDVKKISDTEYVIARSAADKIPGLQKDLMKNARLVPGKGIRLARAPATSPVGQLGMTTGDIIKTINGFDMLDPDKALEGYSRMKTASELTVGLERNGQPMTITIKVQ
jgi:general secretion pathway protein C